MINEGVPMLPSEATNLIDNENSKLKKPFIQPFYCTKTDIFYHNINYGEGLDLPGTNNSTGNQPCTYTVTTPFIWNVLREIGGDTQKGVKPMKPIQLCTFEGVQGYMENETFCETDEKNETSESSLNSTEKPNSSVSQVSQKSSHPNYRDREVLLYKHKGFILFIIIYNVSEFGGSM